MLVTLAWSYKYNCIVKMAVFSFRNHGVSRWCARVFSYLLFTVTANNGLLQNEIVYRGKKEICYKRITRLQCSYSMNFGCRLVQIV
ncbi:hypothetical protein PPYR_10206 [Photinus pyralis]|uniref:Uncharacterized protein n=1 Tax=Photinus pyralis TaxID=7054 RepID=A0A5N4AFP1_PHOPY|nr:hypothetical protein PPYR_10206 [Photinus pyralis]